MSHNGLETLKTKDMTEHTLELKMKFKKETQGNEANTLLPAVSWYKSLSLQQKMGLKEISELICGMKWEDFNILFTPRERIEILQNKLMLEGFDV